MRTIFRMDHQADDLASRFNSMNVDRNDQEAAIDVDEEKYSYETSMNNCYMNNPEIANVRSGNNVLIVTNVDPLVFSDSVIKSEFESLIANIDSDVAIRYLPSLKRIRLYFACESLAEQARSGLNNFPFGNSRLKCYQARKIKLAKDSSLERANSLGESEDMSQTMYLSIPKPTKQFLISPPASPPVGWEPVTESTPCIDVQLISAIANLVPGQVHEIHSGSESQPGIYVEVCEDADYDKPQRVTRTIPKTSKPCFQLSE